ncbi:MAG TPA: hypothetical protein VGG28_09060 [Kofleriaceae bacterium]|jgi:hypothetical protein
MKMKLAILLAGTLLGACGPALQAEPCYPAYAAHTIDVDGVRYVDHGVYDGPPPDDTIIPDDDPPVGDLRLGVELQAQQDSMHAQSNFTQAD